MSRTLSVGVVGLGYWGPNLARNFSQLQDCRLAGLCDLDPSQLERVGNMYPDVPRYEDLDDLLSGPDIDAIVIATPVFQHYPLARAALLAGKHVLVEKPLASSTAECDDLIKLAKERGLTLMVGHTFLYSAPVQMIADYVKSGELGDVRYISSQRLNLGLFQPDINVTWDLAPHDLSIIFHLLGDSPIRVNCQGNAHITPGIEDVSNLSLAFPGGQFATVRSSWLEPRKVREMTIVGSKKMIVYNDIEPLEKIKIFDVRVDRPPHYASFGEFQYSYHYGNSYIPRIEQSEPLKGVCEHFLDCVRTGDQPLSCGRKGREIVRVLEACSRSLQEGGACVELESLRPRSMAHVAEMPVLHERTNPSSVSTDLG